MISVHEAGRGVGIDQIVRAHSALADRVVRTPLVRATALSSTVGSDVQLKLECLQHAGSFKVRGAWNAIAALPSASHEKGVVTFSTGNHGLAVASVARRIGIPVVVFVSELVPPSRIAAIEREGARVVVSGTSEDDAANAAAAYAEANLTDLIHPFDDPLIIAGQGTIGIELIRDCPELDAVFVPVSGGGLIAGIAVAIKHARPEAAVIGVGSLASPAMAKSIEAGHPVDVVERPSLADNLGGGIGLANRHTFGLVQSLVDHIVLVGEAEIADAIRMAFEDLRVVLEGAGAAAIAGLVKESSRWRGSRIAVVASGGNVDPKTWAQVVAR